MNVLLNLLILKKSILTQYMVCKENYVDELVDTVNVNSKIFIIIIQWN